MPAFLFEQLDYYVLIDMLILHLHNYTTCPVLTLYIP